VTGPEKRWARRRVLDIDHHVVTLPLWVKLGSKGASVSNPLHPLKRTFTGVLVSPSRATSRHLTIAYPPRGEAEIVGLPFVGGAAR
jgi:hypothetical protein